MSSIFRAWIDEIRREVIVGNNYTGFKYLSPYDYFYSRCVTSVFVAFSLAQSCLYFLSLFHFLSKCSYNLLPEIARKHDIETLILVRMK